MESTQTVWETLMKRLLTKLWTWLKGQTRDMRYLQTSKNW